MQQQILLLWSQVDAELIFTPHAQCPCGVSSKYACVSQAVDNVERIPNFLITSLLLQLSAAHLHLMTVIVFA